MSYLAAVKVVLTRSNSKGTVRQFLVTSIVKTAARSAAGENALHWLFHINREVEHES
jgi:hypothetical protein